MTLDFAHWLQTPEIRFAETLANVAFGAIAGMLIDTAAFGKWKSHSPYQFHYRRAAVVIATILAVTAASIVFLGL